MLMSNAGSLLASQVGLRLALPYVWIVYLVGHLYSMKKPNYEQCTPLNIFLTDIRTP